MTPERLAEDDYERLLAFRVELRRFLRFREDIAHEHGLTPAIHQLLLAVRGAGARSGPLIGAVAETLDVRHHTVVELAQRAEQLGLIERHRDDDDHRRVHLRLTPKGRRRLEQLSRAHLPAIAQLSEQLAAVVERVPQPSRPTRSEGAPAGPPGGTARARSS